MAMTRRKKLVLGILLPIEVCSWAMAWRDLAHRSDEAVRGRKNMWRAFITINPGNSLFYWLFGRVSSSPASGLAR
ncbi:MAG TPA: hypothetical protein VHT30_01835 [Acidimicrobiales bacterium]|jgi:hypothetical protein|nr:hypothetical protein [Acidimicrobiales bacterium]